MNGYRVQYFPHGQKQAGVAEDRQEVQQIMDKVRAENPEYWPYGLSVGHHDGGVYMIREASTNAPAGWVGWQERNRGLKKVGFYSIGVLPEYRGKGFAKEAVRKIIAEKSATVDEVRAMIVHTNEASKHLAKSLHIPFELIRT
jgi:RimJ/RimL family protein N-acetyltransferase